MKTRNPDSSVIKMKRYVPTKQEDPGEFLCRCSFDGKNPVHGICDSGAAINVMPLRMAKEELQLPYIAPKISPLQLGNGSFVPCAGFAPNVIVNVGTTMIAADFHIIDHGKLEEFLVLGRPFLATVGAVIDLEKKEMVFTRTGGTTWWGETGSSPNRPPV